MRPTVVKQLLTNAMFELLSETAYPKISINMLVEKAGVCRASFYRNYLTKEQIIDEYLQEMFKNIYRKYPLEATDIRGGVESIFAALLDEKPRLLLLGRQGLLIKLQDYMFETTVNEINKFDVLNNRYQPHYFAGATSAMISAWIGYGMEESAADMADLFIKSLYGYMKIE